METETKEKKKKPFYKKWWFWVIVVVVVLLAVSSSSDEEDSSTTTEETAIVEETSAEEANQEEETSVEEVDQEEEVSVEEANQEDITEEMTTAQKNAYRAAKSYLSYTAFSRQGLIDQLTSEYGDGYEVEDATFAIETLEANDEVDWNEQAYESAKSYLEFTAFSRQGLIDQLASEYGGKFEADEATYAIETLEANGEVDWNEQAYESAKSYLEYSSFSLDGLIQQLESEYGEQFTHEEATYGAEKAYAE